MSSPFLEFHADAAAFLAGAGPWLSERPVEATVVATVAGREAREAADGHPPDRTRPHWWLIVRNAAGAVVGAAMRTAPFEPFPPYVLAMPTAGALALARALHDRGESIDGVNGLLPTSRVVAEEVARLTGRRVRTFERVRLWEVGELIEPSGVPGGLRAASPDEAPLVRDWYATAAVAAATRRLLDQGHRVCLFTDVDNPVSNRIYAAVGYRPLTDTANLVIET